MWTIAHRLYPWEYCDWGLENGWLENINRKTFEGYSHPLSEPKFLQILTSTLGWFWTDRAMTNIAQNSFCLAGIISSANHFKYFGERKLYKIYRLQTSLKYLTTLSASTISSKVRSRCIVLICRVEWSVERYYPTGSYLVSFKREPTNRQCGFMSLWVDTATITKWKKFRSKLLQELCSSFYGTITISARVYSTARKTSRLTVLAASDYILPQSKLNQLKDLCRDIKFIYICQSRRSMISIPHPHAQRREYDDRLTHGDSIGIWGDESSGSFGRYP